MKAQKILLIEALAMGLSIVSTPVGMGSIYRGSNRILHVIPITPLFTAYYLLLRVFRSSFVAHKLS